MPSISSFLLLGQIKSNALSYASCPLETLKAEMQALRGQPPLKVMAQAYALVYTAFRRVMQLTPYDEQLLSAIFMARGCVAQMQTGEGKTLSAVFPACLYALTGNGAHIATVNPYLARRDCEWMRPVYEALGFSVTVTEAGMTNAAKKKAYACDVLYGTHSEFGFDYLRDMLAPSKRAQVQRAPNFMLVDEADSILLDEAVTPMILSGSGGSVSRRLVEADCFARYLKYHAVTDLDDEDDYEKLDAQFDCIVLTRDRIAVLTSLGQQHAEQFFRIDDLSRDLEAAHLIYQAIQAYGALHRDIDYIVTDGRLQIVDPHTGRVMEGRRYCDGLWQAIQMKEKLDIVRESVTVASISYQQYFRRYPLLCGMTGTAREGRREFGSVYKMAVKSVPPHRKSRRIDLPDAYAPDRAGQIQAIAEEVTASRKKVQPVLIVTRTVEDNDLLFQELDKRGIPCDVLNAREHQREAEIIRHAGEAGHVTVATAMAGRGTDIHLDEAARQAGGLYVIGFGHQDSRRGDRQLMGRSGRQGDPGQSRFFVSGEDELLLRFDDSPTGPSGRADCIRRIRRAQRLCEGNACGQRETTLGLDEVIGQFRTEIYDQRERILRGEGLPEAFRYLPASIVQAVCLQAIDEAWAVFLREADDARQRCGVVSLVGRDYKQAYIHEVSTMFETMVENLDKAICANLQKIRGGTKEHVDTV